MQNRSKFEYDLEDSTKELNVAADAADDDDEMMFTT